MTTTDLLRRAADLLQIAAETAPTDVYRNCHMQAASLLALADQMERAEPVALTAFQKSAPERVWINVFGTEDDYPDGFPANHEDITWAEDEVGDLDIPYVRADLAHPAPEVTRDAERYRWLRSHCAYRGKSIEFGRGFNQRTPEGLDDVIDTEMAAMQEPKP